MLNSDKQDLPNFAAWSNKNLADFATDAYIRIQEQQDALEQLRHDLKDAMKETRRAHLGGGSVVL
jgi:hypothetical protein